YLSVMRLPDVARDTGLRFRWRPFVLRQTQVRETTGTLPDRAPDTAPAWDEIGRRAAAYGLSPRLPAAYPMSAPAFANQIALLGMENGWGVDFTRAAYRHWFDGGPPPGDEPTLTAALHAVGLDTDTISLEARSARVEQALAAESEAAMALGILGSPSFVVGDAVFSGDDRLDEAIRQAQRR